MTLEGEYTRRVKGQIIVGFNRRFSPLAGELKEFVGGRGPLTVMYRCNAGTLPPDHWISDPSEGGRIIGEACHFFDLFAYLTEARPTTVYAMAPSGLSADDAVVTISYDDGSVCQLTYTSAGPSSYSKERIEVFAGGCVAVLDDFRILQLCGEGKTPKPKKLMQADKGHAAELAAVVDAMRAGRKLPIESESLFATTLVSFAALESIRSGEPVAIEDAIKELTV